MNFFGLGLRLAYGLCADHGDSFAAWQGPMAGSQMAGLDISRCLSYSIKHFSIMPAEIAFLTRQLMATIS